MVDSVQYCYRSLKRMRPNCFDCCKTSKKTEEEAQELYTSSPSSNSSSPQLPAKRSTITSNEELSEEAQCPTVLNQMNIDYTGGTSREPVYVLDEMDWIPSNQAPFMTSETLNDDSCAIERNRKRELTFMELPSDVIQLIFLFGPFVRLSEIPYESVSESYGRLYDGKVIGMFCNVMLDEASSRYCIFDHRMLWKQVRQIRFTKHFSIDILMDVMDRIVLKHPDIHLFVDCEVIMTKKDHLVFDKLSQCPNQIKSLNIFECPSELIVPSVLNRFSQLQTIMFGRAEISDMDSFLDAMKCKNLSLAWVSVPRNSLPTFLQRVSCSHLSLYVIDTAECYDRSYLEGIQHNKNIRSLRLVQKQACLHPYHLIQVNQNPNIKHLSIDLESEVEVEKVLRKVARNTHLHSVELTNYLNDMPKGVNFTPLTTMSNLRNLRLSKPLFNSYQSYSSKGLESVTVRKARRYLETE